MTAATTRCGCRSPAISRSRTRSLRRAWRIATGASRTRVFAALEELEGAPGPARARRRRKNGAPIFVDYAHKPDALEKALEALRPLCERPADRGVRLRRRPRHGQTADDGRDRRAKRRPRHRHRRQSAQRRPRPRSAPPFSPRAPRRGRRSATAREAIRAGVAELEPGDVLLIAGKGHETGQIVGDQTSAVLRSRRAVARGARGQERGMNGVRSWTVDGHRRDRAMRARCAAGAAAGGVHGRLDRQPHARSRAKLFFAIKGDNRDGHDFVAAAFEAGAGVAVVDARKRRRSAARRAAAHRRRRAGARLRDLARAARARSQAQDRRGHRLGRQDQRPRRRCALALAADGRDPCLGRLLQQSLGRAAVARPLPATARYARVRDRHEPCRRDHAAGRAWCARMWRSSPRSSRCISSFSTPSRPSPTPRRRSSSASSRAAPRSQSRQSRNSRGLRQRRAGAGVARIVCVRRARRGRRAPADVLRCSAECSTRRGATSSAADRAIKLGAPGRHLAMNSLAVLAGRRAGRRRSRAGRARARGVRAAARPRRAQRARPAGRRDRC